MIPGKCLSPGLPCPLLSRYRGPAGQSTKIFMTVPIFFPRTESGSMEPDWGRPDVGRLIPCQDPKKFIFFWISNDWYSEKKHLTDVRNRNLPERRPVVRTRVGLWPGGWWTDGCRHARTSRWNVGCRSEGLYYNFQNGGNPSVYAKRVGLKKWADRTNQYGTCILSWRPTKNSDRSWVLE